jgi:hypothetical protein
VSFAKAFAKAFAIASAKASAMAFAIASAMAFAKAFPFAKAFAKAFYLTLSLVLSIVIAVLPDRFLTYLTPTTAHIVRIRCCVLECPASNGVRLPYYACGRAFYFTPLLNQVL